MEPLPEWYVSNLADFFQRGASALKQGGQSLGEYWRHLLRAMVKHQA